jgi:hypothetical protein
MLDFKLRQNFIFNFYFIFNFNFNFNFFFFFQHSDASVLLAWLYAAYQSNIDSVQVEYLILLSLPYVSFITYVYVFIFSELFWLMCQFWFGFTLCVVVPAPRLPSTTPVCLVFIVCISKLSPTPRRFSMSILLKITLSLMRNGEPLLFNATRRSVETIYHRHTETTALSATSPICLPSSPSRRSSSSRATISSVRSMPRRSGACRDHHCRQHGPRARRRAASLRRSLCLLAR